MANNQRGSITLVFCITASVLIAFAGYSFYVGHAVNKKIELANASDFSAVSMAQHASTGLNMIAGNNLAIAAHIHTASAAVFLGRYYAIIQAFLVSVLDPGALADWAKLVAADSSQTPSALQSADNSRFGKLFKALKPLPGVILSAAAGMTHSNEVLQKIWLLETPIVGLTYLKANAPYSAGIPLQGIRFMEGSDDRKSLFSPEMIFSYRGLKTISAKRSFCHAISSSKGIPERDSAAFWLNGLSQTFGIDLGIIGKLEGAARDVLGLFLGQLGESGNAVENSIREQTGGRSCDDLGYWGMTLVLNRWIKSAERVNVELQCAQIKRANQEAERFGIIPLPYFTSCGVSDGGNTSVQSEHFSKKMNVERDIGFTIPDVQSKEDVQMFKASMTLGVFAFANVLQEGEMHNASDTNACPESMRVKGLSGKEFCLNELRSPLPFELQKSFKENRDYVLATIPMSIGFASPEFFPTEGDPTQSQTHDLDLEVVSEEIVRKTQTQLFWPAWRARRVSVQTDKAVFETIGGISRD